MIYTITLKNKKTGQEISRDYFIDNNAENIDFDLLLQDMKDAIDKIDNSPLPF